MLTVMYYAEPFSVCKHSWHELTPSTQFHCHKFLKSIRGTKETSKDIYSFYVQSITDIFTLIVLQLVSLPKARNPKSRVHIFHQDLK